MKRIMLAVLAFANFAAAANAQRTPAADLAGGYSVIQVVKGSTVTAYGGSGSVALNFNDWFGGVGDFGLYHSLIGSGLAAGTYTFGPRFSYRHWGRFAPFTQALFGGVRYANNGLAFGVGVGADIGLDRAGKFALRPQAEYFGFRANSNTTNTVRVELGFVFRIGKR